MLLVSGGVLALLAVSVSVWTHPRFPTLPYGAPLDVVFTPEQARDAGDELIHFIGGNTATSKKMRIQPLAAKAHMDIHDRPEGL